MALQKRMNEAPSGPEDRSVLSIQRGQTSESREASCALFESIACMSQHADGHGTQDLGKSGSPPIVLSQDSQLYLSEPSQVPDPGKSEGKLNGLSSDGPDHDGKDTYCTNGFSEEHLLNMAFEACDTMAKGEVPASEIMHYLKEMTAESPNQEKLNTLYDLLDPEHRDPLVSRDMFHNTMKTWISQCCQNSMLEDYPTFGAKCCKVPTDGMAFSAYEPETEFPESRNGFLCSSRDLLSVFEELKHTRQTLSEQNSGLLKTVSQCEDTNLQLIVEITELRRKLAGAQRSVARVRSLSEELDKTRWALQETEEKATLTQSTISKLTKENECLKAHIEIIEEANQKLTCEKISYEGCVSKLLKMHTDMREELHETLVTLAEKEKEVSKKSMFLDDLKISYLKNYKIIEGMQMELLQLQENFQQELLRFNSFLAAPPGAVGRGEGSPCPRSLQAEIEEALNPLGLEKQGSPGEASSPLCGIVSPHNQRTHRQVLQYVLAEDCAEVGGGKSADRNSVADSKTKASEGVCLESQNHQASIRKHLASIEQEMEIQKAWRTDVESQLARARQEVEEAKKMAAISWWRALKMEENKAKATEQVLQVSQAHLVTMNRLQTAEGTVQELCEQLHHLKSTLRNSQQKIADYRSFMGSEVCEHTENVDVHVGEDHQEQMVKREGKDEAVVRDPEGETQASTTEDASDPATETLMVSVRRAKDLARWACEAAQLACLNEKRFSQAKTRMETATQRMEHALLRAAEAEAQLRRLEASISVKAEPMDHSWLSGPGMSSLASSECTTAEEPRIYSTEEPVGPASKTSGCLSVNDRISFGVEGRHISIQDLTHLEADDARAASPTDKPSSHLSFEEVSWYRNDCRQHPPLGLVLQLYSTSCSGITVELTHALDASPAETSPLHPEENLAGLTAPLSEGNSVHTSTKSPGPLPASCSQHGNKHVGGQDISGQSDTYQSESPDDGPSQAVGSHLLTLTDSAKVEEDRCSQHIPVAEHYGHPQETAVTASPCFRSWCPAMPTLPEEEEEQEDSSFTSPMSYTPAESRVVNTILPTPSIIVPGQANTDSQVPKPLKQTRSQSPRPRLSRNSSENPITTIDSAGHVIDLVKDTLPEVQLSEEDKKKNLELLEEAKKVSDRFLTRRGRRSTCSLSDSPTGLSPNPTPRSSPAPSRSSSLTVPPQFEATDATYASPSANQHLEVPGAKEQGDSSTKDPENSRKLMDWKASEKRKVSSGTLSPRYSPKESRDPQQGAERGKKSPTASTDRVGEGSAARGSQRIEPPATGVAKPVPRPPAQQAPCTAEIKTIGAFPPLMRAMSWDAAGCVAPNFSRKGEEACFPFEPSPTDSPLKSSGYKDFPVQPVKMQKLAQIREEHKLIRNQSIVGSKLPDLSETAEQDRASPTEEECKEKLDVMPNISDVMLRKLKLHRALPGSSPSLTEKEVENAFVQLSLAFRNDSYTLEMRLRHAERERNLTEENAEKELEEFKGCLKGSVMLWHNLEQRETYQRLLETVDVLHRLATRLSSRAEMVGAVRQEKRMNKATEVMMQYVENLKRTYEKDHAELMEFKKLANQNSSRCYGGSMDNGDDGVPRSSRSMSLTLGKALPRRRVSVAVVPKFNLLNIPGQSPSNAGQGLPVLCEANSMRSSPPNEPTQQAGTENGRAPAHQEGETSALTKPSAPINNDEIISELKAKIEEEAYNKGYQEGLKRSKELQELKEEEEKTNKSQEGEKEQDPIQGKKCTSSKYEEALEILERMCPKIFKQNRLLWIVLTLLGAAFFIVSLFTYFSDCYSERGDASTGKSVGPGKKKFFGWNVKNPTPE